MGGHMGSNESRGSGKTSIGRADWAVADAVVLCPDADAPAKSLEESVSTLAAQTKKIEQLEQALLTRDMIGQAKGILMERHRITAEQAFAVLVRTSQDSNTKLINVVGRLVHTGAIDSGPPVPRREPPR